MRFANKLEELKDCNVAIDLVGGASAKGKLVGIEDDFLVIKTSSQGEIYVALQYVTKIWETL